MNLKGCGFMLEQIIERLEENVITSIQSSDLETIFKNLEELQEPTLICGVGGSHVISIFLEKVLEEKNKIIVKNITVEEYFMHDLTFYKNLLLVSHKGRNYGVKALLNAKQKKYLMTARKSRIEKETLIQYQVVNGTKSFVAIENTIIPLSILLCYYKTSTEIELPKKENYKIQTYQNIHIIYDELSKTAANFLESSLVEAGIAPVTLHTKYSLCHGRSNSINNSSLVIYMQATKSELDQLLIKELPKIATNFILLESFKSSVEADYELTIKGLYLLEQLNQEFVKVKYNRIIPTIYHFRGTFL